MVSNRRKPGKIKQWFNQWLNSRLPAATKVTLAHRSVFILPSGFGLLWLTLVLLLFLFGTNYQNNLVIGLSLLLLSVFNTCIIYSYRNLAGMTISSTLSPQAYAGDTLVFPVRLYANQTQYEVLLNYPNNQIKVIKKVTNEASTSLIPFINERRGRVSPGRLKIESRYPLGLCKAWSHVDLDNEHIVYATPLEANEQLSHIDSEQDYVADNQGGHIPGVDEFKGLRQHIPGESLKQVAWKQLAQGRGMLTKEFQQPQGEPQWLSLTDFSPASLENRLSQLTHSVDRLSEKGQIFGLQLGERTIQPADGEAHRISCLQALALVPAQPETPT
ncbi:DUF58 domain-containing protein [Shewanella woodyi]|uniref:Uncharacterized protein n=1 Tax=Shewanella woodyi (strain ATCC 51908 / MS32) TaxID=392500 RepID=B1KHL6_SHEWM|nr:DUF58 domain-containing protein [Shewanella woodyi]ACA86901.1 protein of unknown function DUF58 [Shewanella woodyi ATCC 51908]